MDLTAIQTEVKARGFDYNSTTRLNYWINLIVHRICEREAWPFLETSATGASPLTIADCGRVLSVVDTTNEAVLEYEDYRTLRDLDPKLDDTGKPSFWYQTSSTVISCWPTTSTALSVRYLKIPTDLSSGSDTPVIPTRYHYLIVDGVCAYGSADRDNEASRAMAKDAYEEGLLAMGDALLVVNYDSPRTLILTESTDW